MSLDSPSSVCLYSGQPAFQSVVIATRARPLGWINTALLGLSIGWRFFSIRRLKVLEYLSIYLQSKQDAAASEDRLVRRFYCCVKISLPEVSRFLVIISLSLPSSFQYHQGDSFFSNQVSRSSVQYTYASLFKLSQTIKVRRRRKKEVALFSLQLCGRTHSIQQQ